MSPFFEPFKNGLNVVPWHCLYINIRKIKGAAHKNGDIDATCKQILRPSYTEIFFDVCTTHRPESSVHVGSDELVDGHRRNTPDLNQRDHPT